MNKLKHVLIYTDGACLGNPGPGGYGVVLRFGQHRRELSGGYRKTTNNRMEIQAAVQGLAALTERCHVILHSDSQCLVQAMEEGWARRWQANRWRRSVKHKAVNPDLWAALLRLCDEHDVTFMWVKGHAGNRDNERRDQLAMQAAQQPNLPPDEGCEEAVAYRTANSPQQLSMGVD